MSTFPLKSDSRTGICYAAQSTATTSPVGVSQITTALATGTIRGSRVQTYAGTIAGTPAAGDAVILSLNGTDYTVVRLNETAAQLGPLLASAATVGSRNTRKFTPTGTPQAATSQSYSTVVSGTAGFADVLECSIAGISYKAIVAGGNDTDAATAIKDAVNNGSLDAYVFGVYGDPKVGDRVHCIVNGVTYTYTVTASSPAVPATKDVYDCTVTTATADGNAVLTIGAVDYTYPVQALDDDTAVAAGVAAAALLDPLYDVTSALGVVTCQAKTAGVPSATINTNSTTGTTSFATVHTHTGSAFVPASGVQTVDDIATGLATALSGDSLYDVGADANSVLLRAKTAGSPYIVDAFVVSAPNGTTVSPPEHRVTGTDAGSAWTATTSTATLIVTADGVGYDHTKVSVSVNPYVSTSTLHFTALTEATAGHPADVAVLKLGGVAYQYVTATGNALSDVLTGLVSAASGASTFTCYSDGTSLYVRAAAGVTPAQGIDLVFSGSVSWAAADLVVAQKFGNTDFVTTAIAAAVTVAYKTKGTAGTLVAFDGSATGGTTFAPSSTITGRDGDVAALYDGANVYSYETVDGDTTTSVATAIAAAFNMVNQYAASSATATATIVQQGTFTLTDVSVHVNGAGGVAFTITDTRSETAAQAVTAPTTFRLDGASSVNVGCVLLSGTSYKAHVFLYMDTTPIPSWFAYSAGTVISANTVLTIPTTGYDYVTVQLDTFVGSGVAQVTLNGSK